MNYHVRLLVAMALGSIVLAGCSPPPATARAMSLTRGHREDEAIKVLREDLTAHPDDLAARRMLIRVLAVTGDLMAARVEVAELQRRLPEGDPSPWVELGHAYELTHRFEEALAAYDQAASAAPNSPVGPREGGMRCARWGEVDEARPRLEEAVKRGAHDAETWHALGLVRLHQHDLAAAAEAYRAGVAADPKGTENILGLATVAVLSDDGSAALAAYEALLKRLPEFAPAELGRAWALAKLGRREEARRALDRAESLGAPRVNIAKQRAALAAPTRPSPEPPELPE